MPMKLLLLGLVYFICVSDVEAGKSGLEVMIAEQDTSAQSDTLTDNSSVIGNAPRHNSTERNRIRPMLKGSSLRPVSVNKDHIYGKADATTSLVTFMDFGCGYCRRFWPVLQRAVNDSGGKINWVFRHFPLTEEIDTSMTAPLAAECVAQLRGESSFWQFTKALLTIPRRLADSPLVPIERAALKQGADWSLLQACITRGEHLSMIVEDRKNALKVGIMATPTTVLVRGDTTLLLEGAVTTAGLNAALLQLDQLSYSSLSAP